MKRYIVVRDRQGTGFNVGLIGTALEFKNYFDDYARNDMDEMDYKNTYAKYEGDDIVGLIDAVWDIDIEEYTGTKEQKEAHEYYKTEYNY